MTGGEPGAHRGGERPARPGGGVDAAVPAEGSAGEVVGVGVDLCEVGRLRTVLARTPGFGRRVFTDGERARCEGRRDPAERFAARFAAKEAVLKAMGVGIGACALREIEVVSARSGAPSLVLHGRAARLAADRGIEVWHVSLTHTASMAQATVVATRPAGGRRAPRAAPS